MCTVHAKDQTIQIEDTVDREKWKGIGPQCVVS